MMVILTYVLGLYRKQGRAQNVVVVIIILVEPLFFIVLQLLRKVGAQRDLVQLLFLPLFQSWASKQIHYYRL